jgi:cobalt/nickel transport protein
MSRPSRRPSRRTVFVGFLVAALLMAGIGSFYASSHPDGLEHVAEQTGFLDSAAEPRTADSPFADYGTAGVDDARLGGGLAGVAGVLMVLLAMSAVTYGLRRRSRAAVPADSDA